MRGRMLAALGSIGTFAGVMLLHYPLLRLPYFWDEAGYYIPAAWDIYRHGELVPTSTLPTGHPPLVMIYLVLAWRVFGFSPVVTRAAMVLIAAATVVATYALARRVVCREAAVWGAALLAISPMFFAQSSMVFLDLPAALFTTLATLTLLEERPWMFALTASLALLTKETAVAMLPVAWVYVGRRVRAGQAPPLRHRLALVVPLVPLAAWTFYYHHVTGFWTGNAAYLEFNLYSTLSPARFFWTLLRRLYEVFIGGFNWVLAVGAALGLSWRRGSPSWLPGEAGKGARPSEPARERETEAKSSILLLAAGLIAVYLLMLSGVGGAVLPRYLLPVFPIFFVASVTLIWWMPKAAARGVCGVALVCLVTAWFVNPPYPFAFENNLACADFIRLHQDAARYVESRPAGERILTAWPATDELSRPFLGYVDEPLKTVPLEGFTARDFEKVVPDSFDILYIYSRKWEPENNWLARFPVFRHAQERHFGYSPQIPDEVVIAHHGLKLVRHFERRGQWARIYSRQ